MIVHTVRIAPLLIVLASAALLSCAVACAQSADAQFESIARRWWEDSLERDPLLATAVGDHRFNDRLPIVSTAAADARAQQLSRFRDQLADLPAAELSAERQIDYQIVLRSIDSSLAEHRFQSHLIPITNREGFHVSFPELRRQMPLRTIGDYANYIARLRAFDRFANDHITIMREGVQAGFTLPSVVLQRYREPIEVHLVSDPRESLLYEPLRRLPNSIPADKQAALQAEAQQAIRDHVVPGYRQFLVFMEQEYVPAARGSIGASALPDGRDFYRHRVRHFTTLDMTPEEVHQLGLAEVARIRGEMQQIVDRSGFSGDLPAFAQALREDPQYHAESPAALLREASFILKRIDGKLPELFRTLPRTSYGLEAIPDYIAPTTTSAYYMPPPGDGTRAGVYFLNTYDLKSRPLYELEALSLHEAVPGHHLQIALQQELSGLPVYRRFADLTVFVEGWALYAERLGLEMGFYQSPAADFGRLTYEMWRACRLVVDTGIHYLGWTRQQSIDYMVQHTALSLHNIRAEVDRYISWPGQALAYKIGELKIRELRRAAESQLGANFDIREFHDVVLRNGSVPLEILTQIVQRWIEQQQQQQAPSSE
jgi:uncharacterized protein (DUF885 family)